VPHVTFIHGMANKPPAEDLLRIWCDALADADEPLPLGDLGVSTALIYWADVLYERPEEDLAGYEGAIETTAASVDGGGGAAAPEPRTREEEDFLVGLRAKMTILSEREIDGEEPPVPAHPQGTLERVPLPWFIKRRFLNTFLRDVHHYLFDVEFALPGKPVVHVRETVRHRFGEAMQAPEGNRPHIVVSHSLGTVIAYDCLKRVAQCSGVDGLITLGSPLGIDEIQDKLRPDWTRADGFPSEKLAGHWVNIFDRLDPVCGFDPKLANDYQRAGIAAIEDVEVHNPGKWRHSATKYLRQRAFCRQLRRLLRLRP
jgi:predicted alpha/beta hydrolase family esterase